jgi:hypothetical protein
MKINRITFTGADDKTDPAVLLAIQKEFPRVEWGILFSANRMGSTKYPSQEWIDKLPAELNLSAHFCGKYSRDVIEKLDFSQVEANPKFKRVQLNYTFHKSKPVNLLPLVSKFANRGVDFIFQYNASNQQTLDALMLETMNESIPMGFLYDSSGGRGIEIKRISAPFGFYTGYSGGLTPDNIVDITTDIIAHSNDSEVWIDMEAGVRTDDEFDLQKVLKVLKKVK